MIDSNYTIPTQAIYLPSDLINENWSYRLNGDVINIITNRNCYTNYNTQYCDCYTYNYKQDLTTNAYACNTTSNSNNIIPYAKITNDANYSEVLRQNYLQENIIYIGMFVIGIIFAILLTKERKRL